MPDQQAPDHGCGQRHRRRSLNVVVDLLAFDTLSAVGWRLPLSTFKALVVWIAVASVPVLIAVSHFTAGALDHDIGAIGSPGAAAVIVLVLVVVANLYVGVGTLARDTFSRRRHRVSGSAHEDLYRGLDLDKLAVFVVLVGLRAVVLFGGLAIVNLSVVSVVEERLSVRPVAWGLAVLLPVTLALWNLALASRHAVRPPRPARLGYGGCIALAFGAAVAGWSLALVVAELTALLGESDPLPSSPSPWAEEGVLGLVLVGTIAAGVIAAVLLLRSVRAMARDSFTRPTVLRPLPVPPSRRRPLAMARQPVALVLHRQLSGSNASVALRRMVLIVSLVLAFVGGAGRGAPPAVGAQLTEAVVRGTVFFSFLACLAFVDLVMGPAGISPLIRHLRYLWESGLPLRTITFGAIGYYIVGAAAFALLLSFLPWVTVGSWSPQHTLLGVAVAGAAALGQALTAAPRDSSEGRDDAGLLVALVTMLLATPVLVGVLLRTGPSLVLATVYAAVLVGGANACLRTRITAMPLLSKP